MPGEILVSGYLFKHQKNIVKPWQKKWCVLSLFEDDGKAILHMYDNKESVDRDQAANKKTIAVDRSSLVQATKNKSKEFYFEITTDAKMHGFAADSREELDKWINQLRGASSGNTRRPISDAGPSENIHHSVDSHVDNARDSTMAALAEKFSGQENVAYMSIQKKVFRTTIKPLEKAAELKLHGDYDLVLDSVNIALVDPETAQTMFVWPYKYLRRYGRDRTMFSFEAGRRCDSGPGVFEFSTLEGNEIFYTVDDNVRDLKGLPPNVRDTTPVEPQPPAGYTPPAPPTTHGYTGLIHAQPSLGSTSPAAATTMQQPPVPIPVSSLSQSPVSQQPPGKQPSPILTPQRSLPPVPAGRATTTQQRSPETRPRPVSELSAQFDQSGSRRQSDPGAKKPKPPIPDKPGSIHKGGGGVKGQERKESAYSETEDRKGAWKQQGRMVNIHVENTFNPDQEDYAVPKTTPALEDTYEDAVIEPAESEDTSLSEAYDHLQLNPMKKKPAVSKQLSSAAASTYDTLEDMGNQEARKFMVDDDEGQYETVRQSARGTMEPVDLQEDERGYFTHKPLSQSASVPIPSMDSIRTSDDNPYDYAALGSGFKAYDEVK